MERLKFEYLLQEQYDQLRAAESIDENTLYMVAKDQAALDEMFQGLARAVALAKAAE